MRIAVSLQEISCRGAILHTDRGCPAAGFSCAEAAARMGTYAAEAISRTCRCAEQRISIFASAWCHPQVRGLLPDAKAAYKVQEQVAAPAATACYGSEQDTKCAQVRVILKFRTPRAKKIRTVNKNKAVVEAISRFFPDSRQSFTKGACGSEAAIPMEKSAV